MKLLFVSIFYFLLRSSTSDPIKPAIPVLSTGPGFRYQGAESLPKIQLEMFIDLNCPDSFVAWPIIKQVQENYGNSILDVIVHHSPLPYYRNAVLSIQGLLVIRDETPEFVFEYMETILENWAIFSTANTVDKTEIQVLDDLANFAVTATGIDKDLFTSEIGSKRDETIGVLKYAIKRGTAGTPTFFVNGVDVGLVGAVPSYGDWIEFLDPIVAAAVKRR